MSSPDLRTTDRPLVCPPLLNTRLRCRSSGSLGSPRLRSACTRTQVDG